ncbi:MAG: NnrS family protein [Betaproteobacteria bacterium]
MLSYGFRPFFLGAALWACIAMVLWIGLLSGLWTFAIGYGGIAWHAHEFLFGYIAAVMTGFLLTAIPNWTGRLPLQGKPLLALFVLWLAGRVAMLTTDWIGTGAATIVDCAYLLTVTALISREIVAGGNWRNLRVAVLVAFTAIANIVFQAEVLVHAGANYGLRLGVAAIVALIMVVGGRVTPSFTSNWLTRQGSQTRPAALGRFDIGAIVLGAIALIAWIAAPDWSGTAALLLVMAIAQAARLSRWTGARTWREPILFVLHLGYAFVPLGALVLSISILWPRIMPTSGALHAWTTGAMGLMTLAIMTRATLGHTGRDVTSTPTTLAIYGAVLVAALARIAAPLLPAFYYQMLLTAGVAWFSAFAIFVLTYGPMLVRAKQTA